MKKLKLTTKIFIGLIIGVVIGLFLQGNEEMAGWFQPLGDIYIRLISLIMVPLVFSSLLLGVSNVSNLRRVGKIGIATMLYFMGTTIVAVIIGLVISNVIKPGSSIDLVPEATSGSADFPSVFDTIINIFPQNIFAAFYEVNMLQIIFISLLFGIGIVKAGEKGDGLRNIVESLYEVSLSVTHIVMRFTPIGVIGLIVPVVATNGLDVLLPLSKVILAFYLAAIIQIGLTYSLTVKFFSAFSLKEFYKAILPAQLVGFTTCSSSATLPVTLNSMEELDISKEVSGFILPLGATINMDGNALYQGITALFVAQVYGLDLSLVSQITVVIVGTLASIGAAGVPGAGMIILSMVLSSVGLPLEGVALVAGIDRILDMGRTLVNVTGDASATVIISNVINNRKAKIKNRSAELKKSLA